MRIAYRKILGAQLNPFRRQRRNQYKVKTLLHSNQCKVPTKQGFFFNHLIRKSFQIDEEWRLFYRDSTLGCQVIQDFDLCKLDITMWTQSGVKPQKIDYLSHIFLYRTKT